MDIIEEPVSFRGQTFDVIVAQGLFEYAGEFQAKLFAEIAGLLNDGGRFVLTYQNFGHRKREIYWPYSNVQKPGDFRRELSRFFRIERSYPGSHNWNHSQPGRTFMKASQARLTLNIPLISPVLAVDYLYVCTADTAKLRISHAPNNATTALTNQVNEDNNRPASPRGN